MKQRLPSDDRLIRLRPRGHTACVSSGRTVLSTGLDGFLDNRPDEGLFVHETRLLSRYRYSLKDKPLYPVSASNVDQRSWLGYYIAPAAAEGGAAEHSSINEAAQEAIELKLSRHVGGGVHEDVDLTNFTQRPLSLTLVLEADGDFADFVETHEPRRQSGQKSRHWGQNGASWDLYLEYRAEHAFQHQGESGVSRLRRGLRLRFVHGTSPPRLENAAIVFDIALAPHESWHCCVDWIPSMAEQELVPIYRCGAFGLQDNEYDRRTRLFLSDATHFSTPESKTLSAVVIGALERGKRDLASLRLFDLDKGEHAWTVAAGVPVYVALFGRDTLTAAWEAAPVTTDIMRGTLPVLAEWQGRERNDWRDEQPGRMLHEAHTGPLATLNYTPHGRNYSSVTTSGFYPFVVADLLYWTADKALVAQFIDPAIAALKWLSEDCDDDHDGFCAYQTRSEMGMENQSWKDSGDALVYEDGSQVPKPLATCEEQGIVYAARTNLAIALWWLGRKDEAKRLYRDARELKKRFNDAFWMEEENCFAMALDPNRRQVRSIGSNALHCIATGICDKALVRRTLDRLFADDMFSGWGVRTLSSLHPAYNPYAYHRGTVWPVEHGPFAVGAYRYGFHGDVERICRAQFELAALFEHHRLPECVAGHQRDSSHPFPAVYPAANSPQAWSATTVFTLLQAMLGMQPFAPLRVLFVDPFLPEWLPEITLANMQVGDARLTIRFFRKANGNSSYEVLEQHGSLRVIRQPSPWSLTAGLGERATDILASMVP